MVFPCCFLMTNTGDTMKKAAYIFEIMKKKIHSEEFINSNKIGSKSFQRKRKLPFSNIFSFILNLLNQSIAKELIDFCKICSVKKFTRSAITQSRSKLSPKAFIELNNTFLHEFYKDDTVKTLHGFLVAAIDGSTLELPIDSQEILNKFGCASNQTI